MKRIVAGLIVAGILAVSSAVPALADGWGPRYGRVDVFNPLWPVAAALSIPAAVVGAVAQAVVPPLPVYGYPEPAAPVVYERPAYYQPRVYVAPRAYYGAYYGPRVVYYPRAYRRCWRCW